jgi:xylan 1,4-beta-xylosidase
MNSVPNLRALPWICASFYLVSAARLAPAQPQALPEPAHIITINVHQPARPFPHYWERMFGSPRAVNTMRESYGADLSTVKLATGFGYVRFHGILNDEVGLYNEAEPGRPRYNFTYVDEIYDALLAKGVRPFVEFSFMPLSLASGEGPKDFFYRANVSPPKDWNLWQDMIQNLARHLIDRYGIQEVSQWYFEVWNEPNIDFWAGEPRQTTYFRLYDTTAKALKQVSPLLRVGGPSTAQAAWVSDFIRHTSTNHIPVDFVSTHAYGNDPSRQLSANYKTATRRDVVVREVRKVHEEVKASALPGLPIIISEFNASSDEDIKITDSAFMGPWLAYTIAQCDGLVDTMAYWSFTDSFDAQGVPQRPFHGGLGLIATGHIPKASFNVFALLHQLGETRIPVDSDSVLATRRDDGRLAVAVWNYAPAGEGALSRRYTLELEGAAGISRAILYRVDPEHSSARPAWEAMGKPDFPTREQQQILRLAGRMSPPEIRTIPPGNHPSLSLMVPPYGLVLVIFEKSSADPN